MKRYTLVVGGHFDAPIQCDEGAWVRYEDHAAEVERLRAENERLRAKLEDTDRIGRDALRRGGHPAPDDGNAAYAIGWLEARNDREFRVTQAQREAAIYGAAWAENARFYSARIIDPVECAAAASEAAEKAVEFWRAAQKQTEKETEK